MNAAQPSSHGKGAGGSPSGIELLFLGSGTSHGVPMIGCDCDVCTSDDPRNKRTRSSVLIRFAEPDTSVLIDTSVDFRQQALQHRVKQVDAILFTHHHADHIFGLDDVRTFSDRQGRIECYVPPFSEERIRSVFAYAFKSPDIIARGGLPRLNMNIINGPFSINGHRAIPISLPHGPHAQVFGYRFGPLGYLTDCNAVPDEAMDLLNDLDVLVLDALRPQPHPTHFSIDEAIDVAQRINARRTFFTHISHRSDHDALAASLPANIQPAYDGLVVKVGQ